MIYVKSYCYSDHELPFVIANLEESYPHIDEFHLYEYNYTHTGVEKPYYLDSVLHLIPQKYLDKLFYKKIDISKEIKYAYNDEGLIHRINEPLMRNWFFFENLERLKADDIIVSIDIDEIIYGRSYVRLLEMIRKSSHPLSIRLNQFFFKHNYLWENCDFSSPTIFRFSMVKNKPRNIAGKIGYDLRDLKTKTPDIMGCHMSWIMPVSYMIKKLHSYSHPMYRKFSDPQVLTEAIKKKIYIFDQKKAFDIDELEFNDDRIPSFLQTEELFTYQLKYNDKEN